MFKHFHMHRELAYLISSCKQVVASAVWLSDTTNENPDFSSHLLVRVALMYTLSLLFIPTGV